MTDYEKLDQAVDAFIEALKETSPFREMYLLAIWVAKKLDCLIDKAIKTGLDFDHAMLVVQTLANRFDLEDVGETESMQKEDAVSIRELQKKVHENAIAKGWHEENRTFGELIALCHSELSEALEEYRNGQKIRNTYYEGKKPCGIPSELADTVIRILDMCGKYDIDLESILIEKHEYNTTREKRHGGKVI